MNWSILCSVFVHTCTSFQRKFIPYFLFLSCRLDFYFQRFDSGMGIVTVMINLPHQAPLVYGFFQDPQSELAQNGGYCFPNCLIWICSLFTRMIWKGVTCFYIVAPRTSTRCSWRTYGNFPVTFSHGHWAGS